MQRLECGNCTRILDVLKRDRDRFDWQPVVLPHPKTGRLIERVHGFSRWNGKSLCGRQTNR